MEADMSLLGLVVKASFTVQLVMFILLCASVLSWMIIYLKYYLLKNARENAERFEDQFWSGINLAELYARVKKNASDDSGMARIFVAGFSEFIRARKQAANNSEIMLSGVQRSMKVALAREEERLDMHLSLLATIGSISPYIGLFGTVWGIMRSFIALGNVQQASLAMVAPGIAEALIATAMGLFAAIPAVIAYNRYAERVDRLATSYENFAEEFATILQRQSHTLAHDEELQHDQASAAESKESL